MKIFNIHFKQLEESLTSSLLKNSFYLMLTTLSGAGSGFLFWIFCAKFYSPENVGLAAAIISAMGILSVISRMGLDIGIIRYLSDEEDKNGMINSCLTSILLVSIVVTLVFLWGIEIFSPRLIIIRESVVLFVLFIIVTTSNSLLITQGNIFAALRNTKYSFLQNAIAILRILALPLFVTGGLTGIYISYGLGIFTACLLGNYFILRVLLSYKAELSLKKEVFQKIIRFSFGNYIATIFESIPNFLLPLLVLHIFGAEQNAYFYISWSISALLLMIPKSTAMSLFAEGSYNRKSYRMQLIKSITFVSLILIPLVMIFYMFSENMLAFFGNDYSENASELLKIFSITSIPYTINLFYITTKRIQKEVINIICVYAFIGLFTIIGGYYLVSYYNLIGIALAWGIANGIIAIFISIIMCLRHISEKYAKRH